RVLAPTVVGQPQLFSSLVSPTPALRAVRATGPIHVDGVLDEPAWRKAPPFDGFVELYPREGAAPRRRTEVRLLYDDKYLYVAFQCQDDEPAAIASPLGRRDHVPPGSDSVEIAIDAAHGGRTAYLFEVSAGGVLEDRLLYDDTEETSDWDAVWEAATVSPAPHGWTAEIAVPFSALRFTPSASQVFGVYLQRKVGRTHEVFGAPAIPLGAGAFVSRFSNLTLDHITRGRRPEFTPFVVGRVVTHPASPDAPSPRVSDPSADLGLDFSLPVTDRLGLVGTINPDFGQVEADPVILNLSRYEQFFPEKRPFFQRDLELFQPVGGASGEVPQQLLYTRRIGLDAPILAAGKLTGEVAPGLDVGVFDAFVDAASARAGSSSFRFHPEQPLHLAPERSYPTQAPAAENYFAGVLRYGSARTSSLGLGMTLANPVGPRCTQADASLDSPPSQCLATGGAAVALPFTLRTRSAEFGVIGQLSGSRSNRGSPTRVLPDGTPLRQGDLGGGAYFTAGKLGGEPIRATVSYELATPRLDLNASGYQPDQNVQAIRPEIRFERSSGVGPLHQLSLGVSLELQRSAGFGLNRGTSIRADGSVVLPGFHEVSCDGGYLGPQQDPREIVGAGIPYERPATFDFGCGFATDRHRLLSFETGGRVSGTFADAPLVSSTGWSARGAIAFRPHPRAETIVSFQLGTSTIPGRFVSQSDADLLFADLSARTLKVTLRQSLVLTPRLTLEAYLQLFGATERFGPYYSALAAGHSLVRLADLRLASPPGSLPDNTQATLRANVVLRWEYRLGSSLYLVYSRDSEGIVTPGGTPVPGFRLGFLEGSAITDTFLVKWSVWFPG
ncbi:MAG TPA: DUF5916 domain-containing protein, partial [Anaeromyxobacteraceae bacterium]|nr:DUF5916 domain-containing protein [Anaeromyxobacteraceae bacterium]